MAELKIKNYEVIGIKKEIEEGSLELIFNALQSDIYSFPIKSFIRETISNGLDSVIEKNVFRKINGGDPVEKYFLQRQDGELLKDSEYDPNYYSKDHLDKNDVVTVEYTEGDPRDSVKITDHGVGLGGARLKGYFKIGWSSKRNFLTARGLYGLGSKSALATGVDYFIMTTVYNGYKTSFMIYNRDYEPITPKEPNGRTEVWQVTMANNEVIDKNIHWEKCNEKNSCSIEVEVKKHNKNTYISAVKDQFQYFGGAVNLITQGGTKIEKLDEKPEYESEHLLIPKYSTYSSPHILVDGINYGLVSWQELELENRRGRIALKVSANDVDITQSRETLKWTDKTKTTVLNSIRIAEDEAGEYVRQNIIIENEDNIFALNDAYNNTSLNGGAYNVTSTFSSYLALHNIKPKYSINLEGQKPIKAVLGENLFNFLFYSFDFKKVFTVSAGNGRIKLKTETVTSFDDMSGMKLIYADKGNLGPKLASHLLDKFNTNSFIYIRENTTRVKSVISLTKMSKDYSVKEIKPYALNLIKKYNDIFVDNYEFTYEEPIEDLDDNLLEDNRVNQSKLRKMNKEIFWYTHKFHEFKYSYNTGQYEPKFLRSEHTMKIDQIDDNFRNKSLVVVPSKFTKLGKMMLMMDTLLPTNTKFEAVFVSEQNADHFMKIGGTHITNYFRTLNTESGELMIGEKLRDLNTAWQFKKLKNKYLEFANCSEIISKLSTINQEKYDRYSYQNNRSIKNIMLGATSGDTKLIDEILTYLDNLALFQDVVSSGDKNAIAKKALEIFDTDKIYNMNAYDKDYIDSVAEELERLSVIGPVINSIGNYSDSCTPLLSLLADTINKQKAKED